MTSPLIAHIPATGRTPRVGKRRLIRADLPEPNGRYTAGRKAIIVRAVALGLLTAEAACKRYRMTPEEFQGWQKSYEQGGSKALRVTKRAEDSALSAQAAL